MISHFPPVDQADEEGLLAMGGDLEIQSLILAYQSGIFPWPAENTPLLWFAPPMRAILDFEELHIPKRLKQYLKKSSWTFTVDNDFEAVIAACSKSKHRKGQQGSWITPELQEAYIQFHHAGFAHSFEAFNSKGDLIGGLYGIWIGKYFAGESMFYLESFASQFVWIKTIEYLKTQGLTWLDAQILNPHLAKFGVKEIGRVEFMQRLRKSLRE